MTSCCGRPMSTIQVTSAPEQGGGTLALHSCTGCGRHAWERDGKLLERDEVIGVVRQRLADMPTRRGGAARPVRQVPAPRQAPAVDVRERLSRFQVHGS